MEKFLEFMNTYKEVILTCVAIIITLVGVLIKRKPKTIDDFKLAVSEVLALVPDLIIKVERPNCGMEKKLEVINACVDGVKKSLGRELSNSEILYLKDEVSKQIEEVLSTPKKK